MKISNFILLFFICIWNLKAKDKITITIAGDVMLDRGVKAEINSIGSKQFIDNYKKFFKNSDFGIVNLECAVTDGIYKTPKKFNFKTNFETLTLLKKIGITHLSLANNHTIDYGACGLQETIENSQKAGMIPFGFYYNKLQKGTNEEISPEIMELNGIKVAIFSSVILKLPDYHWDSCDSIFLIHQMASELSKNITKYRLKNKSDFIITLLHWGWEDTLNARYSQIEDSKKIIESGSDLIIGTHPHVIQEIKSIQNKKVYYSIGNFIFDGKKKKGMVLKIEIYKKRKSKIYSTIIN